MNFSLKWNFLYAPTRYRTLETLLQTFQYWDSFAPTCSLGEKSIWTLLLSPMPMTAPIYSVMVQLSEWVYYFPITQRRMLWEEKMYPTSRLIHLRVHHQMSSRSCKTYDWNSTRNSAIQIQCTLIWKCFIWPIQLIQYKIQHNRLLLTGPPHPPQQWLEKWQQNRSIQYRHIQILHVRSYWDIAYMSTNPQFRFANQVNC